MPELDDFTGSRVLGRRKIRDVQHFNSLVRKLGATLAEQNSPHHKQQRKEHLKSTTVQKF